MRGAVRLQKLADESSTRYTVTPDGQAWPGAWLLSCCCAVAAWAVAAAVWQLPVPAQVAGAAAVLLCVCAAAASRVTSESVVVLHGVGVLLVSQRGGLSSSSSSRQFLDLSDLHSVIINETLTTTNIHTHLAFMSHHSQQLAVAFPSLSPRLDVLVPLYRELTQLIPLAATGRSD